METRQRAVEAYERECAEAATDFSRAIESASKVLATLEELLDNETSQRVFEGPGLVLSARGQALPARLSILFIHLEALALDYAVAWSRVLREKATTDPHVEADNRTSPSSPFLRPYRSTCRLFVIEFHDDIIRTTSDPGCSRALHNYSRCQTLEEMASCLRSLIHGGIQLGRSMCDQVASGATAGTI